MLTIDDLVREMRSKYITYQGEERVLLLAGQGSKARLLDWSKATGLDLADLVEGMALDVARKYHSYEFDFGFCDSLVNELWGVAVLGFVHDRPDVIDRLAGGIFWDVFLAFDSGEFYPDKSREDPAERFTRPMVATLLARADA